LTGCSFAIGGATAAVVVTAGVLASSCYDHVDVTVRDPGGAPVCDAEVVAIRGGSETELGSCYHAALTAGSWRIQARRGNLGATSTLVIPEDRECGRIVQHIDLTLAQAPTNSLTANPMRSSGTTSSTTPSSTAALGMP
jgi:hypothetical protein